MSTVEYPRARPVDREERLDRRQGSSWVDGEVKSRGESSWQGKACSCLMLYYQSQAEGLSGKLANIGTE